MVASDPVTDKFGPSWLRAGGRAAFVGIAIKTTYCQTCKTTNQFARIKFRGGTRHNMEKGRSIRSTPSGQVGFCKA